MISLESGDIATANASDTTAEFEYEFGFADIVNADQIVTSSWYGTVVQGDTGSFEINGNLIIGDVSGGDNTTFRSENEIIVFPDNNLPTINRSIISCDEDTGRTRLYFGSSSGSGDAKVGFGGTLFYKAGEVYDPIYSIDFSNVIDTCLIYGCTFLNAGTGIIRSVNLSSSATNNEFISNTVANSGEIHSDDTIVRNCFFNSTISNTTRSAFLWSTNTDIKNSFFNGNAGTNISAIRHTDGTTRSYDNLKFAGNTFDVFLNHASANLTINNINNSDASTFRSSGSGTVSFVTTKSLAVNDLTANDEEFIGIYQSEGVDSTSVDKNQFSSHASNNSASDTTFETTVTIPADIPTVGTLKIIKFNANGSVQREDSHAYTGISGVAFTGLTPSLAVTYDGTDRAYAAYIEKVATVDPETYNYNYVSDRQIVYVWRKSGFKQFKKAGVLASTGSVFGTVKTRDPTVNLP